MNAASPVATNRSLENSEREFMERFSQYAVAGSLYPQTEGSPLLEFSAAGRVLYLFDRTGPYCGVPGEATVLVHGIVEPADLSSPTQGREKLEVTGISAVRGEGRVLEVTKRTVVVQARLPLVLSTFEALPAMQTGEWLSFLTQPPLHGFVY